MRWQTIEKPASLNKSLDSDLIVEAISDDLNTPLALSTIATQLSEIDECLLAKDDSAVLEKYLSVIDKALGLSLLDEPDVSSEQKVLLAKRQDARLVNDWQTADKLRAELHGHGLAIRDSEDGQIWSRLK
jgi:cysteinyl-tRNA synthetase